MTIREQALAASLAKIGTAVAGVASVTETVTRNAAIGERLEGVGRAWVNLVDGSAGEPTAVLGGGGWEFAHTARAFIAVRDGEDSDATFDAIVSAIAAAYPEGETLGGLVDLAEVQAVEAADMEVLALTIGFKVGELPILFVYTAPSAAG